MLDRSCPTSCTWARTLGSSKYFLPVLCDTAAMMRSIGIPASDVSLALSDAVSAAGLTPLSNIAASPAATHVARIDFIIHSLSLQLQIRKILAVAADCLDLHGIGRDHARDLPAGDVFQ